MYFLTSALHGVVTFAAAPHSRHSFHFGWSAQPVIALVAGIFILIRPKLLNFIVAIYLVLVGLMGLFKLPW